MRFLLLFFLFCLSYLVSDSVANYRPPHNTFPSGIPTHSLSYDYRAGRHRPIRYVRSASVRLAGLSSIRAGAVSRAAASEGNEKTGVRGISSTGKNVFSAESIQSVTDASAARAEVNTPNVEAPAANIEASTANTQASTANTEVNPTHTDANPTQTDASAATTDVNAAPTGAHTIAAESNTSIAASETIVQGVPEPAAAALSEAHSSALSIAGNDLSLPPPPAVFKEEHPLALRAPSAKDAALAAFLADSIRNSLMDPHGVQFGGIAGLNWSGASATGNTGKISGKPLTGLTLGVFADVPLKKRLSFRPSVQYAYEGYQPDINGNRVNIHVAYLNIPLHIVYHTNLLKKRFFVGGGPYLAYAVNGVYTFKGINTDMNFGNNYGAGDNLRKMDYGAGFITGLLLDRNFVLGAKVDVGLQNIAPGGFNTQIHTRSAGLSIMYVFRNRANMGTYQFHN